MPTRDTLGGIVHAYQKYDPVRIPPPRPQANDFLAPVMEHALAFGDLDELTDEQLAVAEENKLRQVEVAAKAKERTIAVETLAQRQIFQMHHADRAVQSAVEHRQPGIPVVPKHGHQIFQ